MKSLLILCASPEFLVIPWRLPRMASWGQSRLTAGRVRSWLHSVESSVDEGVVHFQARISGAHGSYTNLYEFLLILMNSYEFIRILRKSYES